MGGMAPRRRKEKERRGRVRRKNMITLMIDRALRWGVGEAVITKWGVKEHTSCSNLQAVATRACTHVRKILTLVLGL